jgi:plasmid stabilization system protein ParE
MSSSAPWTRALRQSRSPELYPIVYKSLRRALMRRFPYAVYYGLTPESIVIAACIHGRQHPRRWRRRA